jgi:hypothetical protein
MQLSKNYNMADEIQLTEKESFEIITSMINKAKCDYRETGVGALMWGSLVTFCSLITFANYYLHLQWVEYVWFLTYIAVVPQIIISVRESRRKKYKTYNDDAMGGIWISFGVGLALLIYFVDVFKVQNNEILFLIIYGIPTFATGYARKFKPMIIGGIACWAFAVISMYTPFPYRMLLSAAAAQLAWFIPGLILRRRYLNAKEKHV